MSLDRDMAITGLAHIEAAVGLIQGYCHQVKDTALVSDANTIQKLILSLRDGTERRYKINLYDEPAIFRPAFPKATRKHL